MSDPPEDPSAKRIPIRDLHVESGAEELLELATMGTNEQLRRTK